jgi:hypothetical protein
MSALVELEGPQVARAVGLGEAAGAPQMLLCLGKMSGDYGENALIRRNISAFVSAG